MQIIYLPQFVRLYKKLPESLRVEIKEKIALFSKDPAHPFLKTHKLHGIFKNNWSFSVNYRYRIVFQYLSKNEVVLLAVGDHEIYK